MGGAEAGEERNRCGGLLTDLYELNMAVAYLRRGMRAAAPSASSSGSSLPDRGFLVAAGLADCLKFLERFGFPADELDWLGSNVGLDQATLDAFAELGFTGDVWAVPEGRVVLAREPVRADRRAAAHGDPCGGQGRVAACGS
jgi:nicotinate phosphoribosyltransferase